MLVKQLLTLIILYELKEGSDGMVSILAPEHLCKQPGETRTYSMDFTNLMSSSETIRGIRSVSSELRGGGATDLTISNTGISDQTVTMNIAGGTHSNTYRIEVTVETSADQIIEADGILLVRD